MGILRKSDDPTETDTDGRLSDVEIINRLFAELVQAYRAHEQFAGAVVCHLRTLPRGGRSLALEHLEELRLEAHRAAREALETWAGWVWTTTGTDLGMLLDALSDGPDPDDTPPRAA
ncbi:MAG: hypothetical protein GWO16_08375 [Gammaproteobacteria bacterium]|nr:hypothetical protein [Gammaproteobacteria bacterium]NIR97964.1 hypothetical protein [Gammaproteobacteria bacterium]NIT63664.1 hypothetical protein [Gammaproteobacteria bacterium]NIV21522.1 hypothetical protein [Gammaproteobacteria bacterium]NIY32244.1 hypothetical protein [Gammaproteobacteria bacterium]